MPVDCTPVWFMRQAGRCLPEYRAMRQQHSFMEMATTPELAAAATLLPVDLLGVDAAVLFADIMLPLASLGVPFEIRPGVGPVIPAPIRSSQDIARLELRPATEGTPYVPARVKWFDKAKGFGFANVFGHSEDVFVHIEVLRRFGLADLQPGEAVTMRVVAGPRGKMAGEVRAWDYVQED